MAATKPVGRGSIRKPCAFAVWLLLASSAAFCMLYFDVRSFYSRSRELQTALSLRTKSVVDPNPVVQTPGFKPTWNSSHSTPELIATDSTLGLNATDSTPGLIATDSTSGLIATDSTPGLNATDSTPGLVATDSTPGIKATDSTPGLIATDSIPGLIATDSTGSSATDTTGSNATDTTGSNATDTTGLVSAGLSDIDSSPGKNAAESSGGNAAGAFAASSPAAGVLASGMNETRGTTIFSEVKTETATGTGMGATTTETTRSESGSGSAGSQQQRRRCDYSRGRWVYDESYPLYRSRDCPFLDGGFRCEENGRPDTDFMKWRWQPHDCDLPRFNAKDMLERLRNQRVVFVGDSLGRNQWESMLCMLASGVHNKSRIYETRGQPISKHVGSLVFKFQDFNLTVEYYREPFLVPQTRPPRGSPRNVSNVLVIDQVSWTVRDWWPGANILVLNSGHWWSAEKIFRGGGGFQMDSKLTTHGLKEAFQAAVNTWTSWLEKNLNPKTTQVFFRSYAPVHFRGGTWNSGGHCDEEVKPLTDEEVEEMQPTPWTNKYILDAIKTNLKKKRHAVEYMDITTSTNYRADAHSGLYSRDSKLYGRTPRSQQDCSHFCLPGVPDTWNELLYATLLARGQGVWGESVSY